MYGLYVHGSTDGDNEQKDGVVFEQRMKDETGILQTVVSEALDDAATRCI